MKKELVAVGVGLAGILWIATRAKAEEPGTAKLYGTVTDDISSEPVSGVKVLLVGTGWSTFTNSNGEYEIINITPGIYEIQYSKTGYSTVVL